MGRRNDDRIPVEVWRERAPTVWLMAAYGWRITSRCLSCNAQRPVDLVSVGRKLGPQYSLWDRVSRCRQVTSCWGVVVFVAKPPGMHIGVHLCSGATIERAKARLERARQAWAARQPNLEDPRNFGGAG